MSDRLLYGQIRLDRMQVLQQHFAAAEGARFRPPTDVYETEDAIVVIIEVAGLQEDHFEISLSQADQVLTVQGRRQSHGADAGRTVFHQIEIPYGVFAVDVPMPWPLQEAESATADYQDGFLVITLPKAQPRHVPVRVIGESLRS
ncbi:MAG: Hsp20/alpha crystallin family protein [Caldilineales bacterium]